MTGGMLQMRVIATGTAVVRNRMPGGVGGRRERSRLLPDRQVWRVAPTGAVPLQVVLAG